MEYTVTHPDNTSFIKITKKELTKKEKKQLIEVINHFNQIRETLHDNHKEVVDISMGLFLLLGKLDKKAIEDNQALKRKFVLTSLNYAQLQMAKSDDTPWAKMFNQYLQANNDSKQLLQVPTDASGFFDT